MTSTSSLSRSISGSRDSSLSGTLTENPSSRFPSPAPASGSSQQEPPQITTTQSFWSSSSAALSGSPSTWDSGTVPSLSSTADESAGQQAPTTQPLTSQSSIATESSLTSAVSSVSLGPSQSSESGSMTIVSTSDSPVPTEDNSFKGFRLSNITLTIDGIDYHPPLPGQDPLVIILSDSTTATITSSAIVRNGASLAIPSYQELVQSGGSSSQQLSSWSVQFGTRHFQPSICFLSIFGCFLQAQSDFMSVASSIGNTFVSMAAKMMQAGIVDAATAAGYASEASSYSVTANSLLDGLSDALSSLEGAAEALDGAMQAVNENLASFTSIELEELTEAGRIFSSYPEVSLAKGMFSNLANIGRIAWANSPDVIQSLWSLCQAQWLPITAGGALVTSVWVLNEIGQGEETVEEPDEDRVHFILLEQGFSIPIFHLWTFTLDENKGTKTAVDASVNDDLTQRGLEPAYGPGYTTRITVPKATIVRALPFVRIVYTHPTFDQKRRWGLMHDPEGGWGGWGSDGSKASQNHFFGRGFSATRKRELEQSQAQRNLAAFSHYKGVEDQFTYTRDSSGGEGVTIFITDTGGSIDGPFWQVSQKAWNFRETHTDEVEQSEMHNPEWYVVPNELSLPNVPEQYRAPEDMTDWNGHGTCMACLAGGDTYSLAPKSHLYLIKLTSAWLDDSHVILGDDATWVSSF